MSNNKSNKYDVILCIGSILLFGIFHSGITHYLDGYYLRGPLFLYSTCLGIFLGIVLLLVLGGRLLVREGRKDRIKYFLITIFCFVVFIAFFRPTEQFLKGFRDRVKSQLEVEAIRAWVPTIKLPPGEIFVPEPWPAFIMKLQPPPSHISLGEPGSNTIWLQWGGGFGYWGILIGPESFKMSSSSETLLPYKAGVYFCQPKK
jgi:hypothetical protein